MAEEVLPLFPVSKGLSWLIEMGIAALVLFISLSLACCVTVKTDYTAGSPHDIHKVRLLRNKAQNRNDMPERSPHSAHLI